jgi:hypothetical protein
MTYETLLTEIHSHFDQLHAVWTGSMDQTRSDGLLAVLPGGYGSAAGLADVEFSFWSREMLHDYLTAHRQETDEPLELLDDIDVKTEFPVFIVEAEGGGGPTGFHLHRILRVEKN